MLAAAQRIYDRLVALGFGTTDLQTYLGGIGDVMFQEIEDLASDGPLGQAGWSSLLDINRVPDKALPWLGQFVGVQFPAGLTPADQKIRIQNTDGWKRGTPAAIAAAPLPYLGGTKTVILRERDPAAAPNDPAYGLTVITKRNETPYALKAAAAPLTVSGAEITDVVRALGVQGDGRLADSSFGIWEATTQRLGRTNDFTHADWTAYFLKPALTPGQADPFGGTNAFRVSAAVGAGPGNIYSGLGQAGARTPGEVATVSVWMRCASGTRTVWLGHADDSTSQVTLTTTWQRFKLTITASATPGAGLFQIYISDSGGGSTDWFIFAPQSEVKPLATPYYPNTGAAGTTTTRTAARVQAPATLLDATQTWFAARIYPGWASGVNPFGATVKNPRVASWRTTYPDAIEIYFDDASNTWNMNQGRTGGAQIVATHAIDGAVTLVGYVKNGEIGLRLNGSAWTKVVLPTVPLVTANLPATFELGSIAPGAGNLDGRMAWLACGVGVPTDADADALYALGDTEPTKDTLSPGAMLTAVFPFNTSSYQDLSGPDPKVLAALVEQKPAGIILNYQVLAGADYSILLASNPLYSNVFANFLTYQGVINNVPGT